MHLQVDQLIRWSPMGCWEEGALLLPGAISGLDDKRSMQLFYRPTTIARKQMAKPRKAGLQDSQRCARLPTLFEGFPPRA